VSAVGRGGCDVAGWAGLLAVASEGYRASGGDLGTRVTISLLPVRTGHRPH
jgi:hypothetical protein